MQDKLIEAAKHVVDEMERGYPILGPVCRLKEALAAVRAHDAGKVSTAQNAVDAGEFFVTENRLKEVLASFHAAESAPQLDAEDPAEPVEDVVSRMCKLMGGCACEHCIKRMTASLAVAREGYWSLEDMEKAILAQARGFQVIPVDELPEFLKQALAPKPSTEERVTIVRWLHDPSRWIVLRDGWNPGNHDGFKDRKDAERYAAGLRLELAAYAALFPKTGGAK